MSILLSRLSQSVLRYLSCLAIPAVLIPALAAAQTATARVTLATRAPQALASAIDAGQVPSSQQVSLTLTLAPTASRAAALDTFLTALTTPSSPSYHHWITPAQFASSYGATSDQLASVTAWAQSQGLSIDAISPAGTRLSVSGSASKVQTAFATSLHLYQAAGSLYFANVAQPSLPAETAALISAIDGLDNLPSSSAMSTAHANAKGANVVSAVDFGTLAGLVDANTTPILSLSTTAGTSSLSASQLAEYALLFRQAAAQGITAISATSAGNFPGALPEVTSVALPGDAAPTDSAVATRPDWQSAPGLSADGLRDAPDLTVSSLAAFAQTMSGIAAGKRLGNINPTLYLLGPTPGLYTQPDAAPAGTWEIATGLGVVDPGKLASAFPNAAGGASFTSFSATNYSPTHGQGTSFTSVVTSGTGGATPTGTVAFVTSTGTVLGTVALVGGSATLSINTLDGGNYVLNAQYSGDGTYAPSQSPTSQIYVAPEPSKLTAAITGTTTVGSNFVVTVTDTVTYGQPTGPVTLTISGTNTVLTGTLAGSGPTSSTVVFTVPSPAPGGITLSIVCTSSQNYSCYNPLTTTVQIAKATPVLSISYTPNPPISGQSIALNGVVSTIGNAPAPTGSVTFFDNGTTLNAGQLSNGSTSTTGVVPTTSSHSISATYAGDSNYNTVTTAANSTTSGTINTTTTVTASSYTVNTGQTITLTATVAASGTGPAALTGTVQFLDNGVLIGTSNLSNNTAAFVTSTLSPTINHTITAIYSGDGNYSTSTSGPIQLQAGITSNSTTTAITASTLTPVHGRAFTLTATVTPPTGGTIATGTITFNSTPYGLLGSSTLVNGVATLVVNVLPGGVNSISATYNPAGTYTASTSAGLNVNVTPEPTTITVALPYTAVFGSAATATVNVTGTSGIGFPSGNITFQPTGSGYSNAYTATLGSGNTGTSSSGVNVTFQATGAGSVIASVSYIGDANFAASGPVSQTFSVARAASSVSFTYQPNPIVSGQPVVLTAKVSFVGTIAPTGTIQFLDGNTLLGTAALDATGTATLTTTLSAGNHLLMVSYSGDGNYLPGTSPAVNTTTGTTATVTALTLTPASATVGQIVTLSASVGPNVNGSNPTGTVQFLAGTTVLCTATIVKTTASCTITPATAATTNVVASYLGDTNFAPSSSAASTLTVSVGAGALIATLSSPTVPAGGPATITASATAPAGVVPTGTIQASLANSAGVVISTFNTQLPGNGTTNTITVNLPINAPGTAGAYTITVSCVNTNFTCAPVTLSLAATANGTTTGTATLSAAVAPATALPGSTANVTGAITAVAGTVINGTLTATITNANGTVVGSPFTLTLPGTAVGGTTYTIPITVPATAGTYTVTVTCTSTNFTCAPASATLVSSTTATTLIATTTVLTAATSTTTTGATILTATVLAGATGTTYPTGTVTFYDGTTPLAVATVTAGVATATVTLSTTATHSLTAVYSGDLVYATSTSTAITGVTSSTIATITLSASTTNILAGQNVVLTAIVSGLTAKSVGPTGTVSFYAQGTVPQLLGTVTLGTTNSGVTTAVLSTTGLPSGTLTIYAVYNGDTNFTAVTSNTISIGLSDFNVVFTPPTITTTRGTSAISTATVSIVGGFTGSIALGCAPAPDTLITCSFSPAVLTGPGTSTLIVNTTAPKTAALQQPSLFGGVSLAALLCLLIPGRGRRRIPALLVLLFGLGLAANIGCATGGSFTSPISGANGTPLGTSILTISTAGSNGSTTVKHIYSFQVTVQ